MRTGGGAPSLFCALAVAIAAVLFMPIDAAAQACDMPVSVMPASPDSRTPVTLAFRGYAPQCSSLTYLVAGNQIRLQHAWLCGITETYAPRELPIGTLPPGTYDVRFVRRLDDPESDAISCGAFTVAAAEGDVSIPTLTEAWMVGLFAMLSIAGLAAVRRMS
jgi:hypothetical protein